MSRQADDAGGGPSTADQMAVAPDCLGRAEGVLLCAASVSTPFSCSQPVRPAATEPVLDGAADAAARRRRKPCDGG